MNSTWQDQKRGISVKLDGDEKRHGIVSLTTGDGQPDIVRDPYFLMNIYRVLADGKLWTIARGEPFTTDWHGDGMTLHWNPTATLPAELRASYVVEDDATVTLRFRVRAVRDLKQFEVSVGSYFDFSYEPYAVLSLDPQNGSRLRQPVLWKAEDQDFVRGHYIHLPRDDQGSITRMDGRWNSPETGKSIAPAVYGPEYGWPVAVMASKEQQIYVVQSTSRDVCDGISITYSSDNVKDNIRNHNATYFSLFGEDLKQGDEREAVIRQHILNGAPSQEKIAEVVGIE